MCGCVGGSVDVAGGEEAATGVGAVVGVCCDAVVVVVSVVGTGVGNDDGVELSGLDDVLDDDGDARADRWPPLIGGGCSSGGPLGGNPLAADAA